MRHEVAEGDGPVNALDAALRKALNGAFPNLADMQLVDYKVRVINTEAGTAAGVRVVIESRDEHDVWGTVGVSENIIEASWIALVDSFEYKLCKDEASSASVTGRANRCAQRIESRLIAHVASAASIATHIACDLAASDSLRSTCRCTSIAELPKQYDHAGAQRAGIAFWEERGYFHSEPDPTREAVSRSSFRRRT